MFLVFSKLNKFSKIKSDFKIFICIFFYKIIWIFFEKFMSTFFYKVSLIFLCLTYCVNLFFYLKVLSSYVVLC